MLSQQLVQVCASQNPARCLYYHVRNTKNFNLILSVAMSPKTIIADAGLGMDDLTAIAKATVQVHPSFPINSACSSWLKCIS